MLDRRGHRGPARRRHGRAAAVHPSTSRPSPADIPSFARGRHLRARDRRGDPRQRPRRCPRASTTDVDPETTVAIASRRGPRWWSRRGRGARRRGRGGRRRGRGGRAAEAERRRRPTPRASPLRRLLSAARSASGAAGTPGRPARRRARQPRRRVRRHPPQRRRRRVVELLAATARRRLRPMKRQRARAERGRASAAAASRWPCRRPT